MDDLRKEKRAPILLKVKYKSASVDEFIQQSGLDISRGGIFIKTKTPMDIGTVLKFEFQLSDGAPVIHGVGRVAWRRTADVATRDLPPGMGVKFIKLDPESRTIVDRTVSQRGASASRYDAGDEEPSGPQPSPIAAEPITAPRPIAPATPAAPATPPVASAATSRAAASALKPSSSLPLPPIAKAPAAGPGVRPAPPGVFSAPTRAPAPPAAPASSGAFGATPARARDSASGRATLPSADPFADAEAPTSFFPKGPPASSPANEDSTQVRHVSEFLASVMNEAGASDQSVTAEAQATAEKARRREHEVEEQRLAAMEAQLFGDMGEQTASVPLRPVSLSPKAAVEKDFDPFASEPPRGSPEIANPVISKVPAPSAQTLGAGSMQASLSPSSKQAETGRQQGFGAAQATASEAKFPAPEMPKPVLSLPNNDVPSLPAPKKSSAALPLVAVVLLLGAGAFWYFQLGGAQMIAGGAKPTVEATPAPTPETAPTPTAAEPTAAAPSEPAEAPTPTEPTPTEPTPAPVEQAPAVLVDLQITSVPKDATLSIDGVDQGKTPKRVKVAVGSTVNVTVSAFGHKPMTQAYTVLAKNEPLRFKLETMAFVLTVRTVPADAHVTARSVVGDNGQPMNLGFLSGPVTVNVTKSGFTKKQRQVGLDAFVERDGVMVAEIEVGLRRPGATVDGDVPVNTAEAPTPAPSAEPTPAPAPEPRPAPVEATPAPAPRPEPEPEPEPAPRPAPRPDPAPALPDNPF